MPELSGKRRLHGGTESASGGRVKAVSRVSGGAKAPSLDAHVKRRHAQTSQLDLDSQDSRLFLWEKLAAKRPDEGLRRE